MAISILFYVVRKRYGRLFIFFFFFSFQDLGDIDENHHHRVRYQAGLEPVLITIECRERSKVQDDTWIEQLIIKREKIGAQKTVAVSSSGFTEPAIVTAKKYGIELRFIDEIPKATISNWVNDITIQKVTLYDAIVSYIIEIDEDNAEFTREIQDSTRERPFDTIELFRSEDDAGMSINDLLENFYRWQSEGRLGQDSYAGIAGDDDLIGRRITINFNPGILYTLTARGKFTVVRVTIDLHTRIERQNVPLSRVYQYSNPEKAITQVAVGAISLIERSDDKLQILVQPSHL